MSYTAEIAALPDTGPKMVDIVPHQMYKSRKSLRRWYRKVTQQREPDNYEQKPVVEITEERLAVLVAYCQTTFRPLRWTLI